MSRVTEGIILNNQHIYNIEHNIVEQPSFSQKILRLGYNNLEEFFEEKREHEMQEILKNQIYDVEPKDAMKTLRQLINDHASGIVSVYTTETCVHHGQDPSKFLDVQLCKELNIPIYDYDSYGGNIIATEGDYSIALLIPSFIDISAQFFLEHIKIILEKYFTNVIIQDNDIILDGNKVVGVTSFGNDEFFFVIAHFSMSSKEDLIYELCGEPVSNKIPGYIDTDVLSTEQLMEDILSWLQGL